MLVMASIANHQHGQNQYPPHSVPLPARNIFSGINRRCLQLCFPINTASFQQRGDIVPPSGIVEVMRSLLMSMVSNPIDALLNANYIGILVWAVGWALHCATAMKRPKSGQ